MSEQKETLEERLAHQITDVELPTEEGMEIIRTFMEQLDEELNAFRRKNQEKIKALDAMKRQLKGKLLTQEALFARCLGIFPGQGRLEEEPGPPRISPEEYAFFNYKRGQIDQEVRALSSNIAALEAQLEFKRAKEALRKQESD